MAKVACRVIAIEPYPKNYSRLLHSMRGIKASNVLAINVAISNKCGKVKLYIHEETTHPIVRKSKKFIEVPCLTLTWLEQKLGLERIN